MSKRAKPARDNKPRVARAAADASAVDNGGPRVIWKGSVGFGLVHIPVALYAAEQREELALSMVDRRDAAPIGYQRINKHTGEEVPWEDVVKGYEYEPDRYVLLGSEDFRSANRQASRSADIFAFVDASEIPLPFYDRPYYLEPLQTGDKVYALLRETLRRTGKVGLAKVVLRNRQHLAVLLPYQSILVLNLLRFATELREPSRYRVPSDDIAALGITRKELEMAQRLVEDMVEPWQPELYTDDYRNDLMALVQHKIAAGETTRLEPERGDETPESADVIDLMALLKRSVAAKTKQPVRAAAGRKHSAAKPAARSRRRA